MRYFSCEIGSITKSCHQTPLILAMKSFKINVDTIKVLIQSLLHEITFDKIRQLIMDLIIED